MVDVNNKCFKLSKDSPFEIKPPFLYKGTWTVAGGMYAICEYGMQIARTPNVETALRIVKALEKENHDLQLR